MAALASALFPSPTLARYSARLFFWRAIAFLAGLVLILQTLDLLGESGRILAVPGNDDSDLWRYVSLRLPQLVALFLPFSVLLGALLTYMTLNQNSEIVIFKAAGISAHQFLAPFMLTALAIAMANFAFNELVLTRAKKEFDAWKAAEYHPLPPADGPRAVWVRSGPDLVLAGSVSGSGPGTVLGDLTIYDREADRLVAVIRAPRAVPSAGGWLLSSPQVFDVASGTETRLNRLDLPLAAAPEQFTVARVRAEELAFWNLWPAIRALDAAGKPTDALRAELWHKVSGPMSTVLMPLLAAVAAFGLARSGRLFVRAVIGLGLGFAFFVADNFAMAMAEFGALPPLAAAWAPFLLFMLIGESLLFRTEE